MQRLASSVGFGTTARLAPRENLPDSDVSSEPGGCYAALHPVGMTENSPAFQRWDRGQQLPSPEGTAENHCPSRPFGTYPAGRAHPALKRWAILVCPSGTGRSRLFPMGAITQILVALDIPVRQTGCEELADRNVRAPVRLTILVRLAAL